ncbi:hypothetical protein DWV50_08575, partial [Coprobacillus sp. AF09-1A]
KIYILEKKKIIVRDSHKNAVNNISNSLLKLTSAILSLNVDDYSMKEWHDAIIYLTGNDVDKSIGKAAAKEYLCDYYRHN